jgi:hypothetical protein
MIQKNDDIALLRWSIQRAFLGRIVPTIRAVTAEITSDCRIVRVFFDGTPDSPALDLLSEAEAEMLADYPDNKVSVKAVPLPIPEMIPRDRGIWVYARYEPT